MSEVVGEVRKFVEEECKKPTSNYGYEPFTNHFIPVVNYVKILGEKLNVEVEIVELAAWLHDIGSIVEGRENHHISGSEIAEKKLKELNYPQDKIEKIKHCILNHRGSKENENKRETIEAQILVDADALSHFDEIEGLFKAALVYENLDQYSAKKSVMEKLKRSYNKLSFQESKKLIKPKLDAAILLFGEDNGN
jgi:uncharacterized protein